VATRRRLTTNEPVTLQEMSEALIRAVERGMGIGEIKRLIEGNEKALVNGKERLWGRTALHVACNAGDLDMASFLLSQGADIDALDSLGWTPLHCACEAGHLRVCEFLLDRGANTSIKSNDGNLALHYIASRGAQGKAGKKGDDEEEEEYEHDEEEEVRQGDYAPGKVRWWGESDEELLYTSVLCKMLKAGGDVNTQNRQGETPLHKAVLRGSCHAVKCLIKFSQADVNARNKCVNTLFIGFNFAICIALFFS
jgi:hypothetical protein